jgi:L-lactate dehydrogenase complex protein LldG
MDTLFETFKAKAEAVSAEVHRFPGTAPALAFILEFLRGAGVSPEPQCGAVWAAGPFADSFRVELQRVPGLRFEVSREAAAEARVGVSQMDWAMADTGTLVQDAAGVDQRLVATLPPIHLAVLGTERILADLGAVLGRIRPEQTNYISFITGPSRTADIERVLTIGAHGPERLVIVAIDGLVQP